MIVKEGPGKGHPRWKYRDSIGREHFGWVEQTFDRGHNDVTYFFRDEKTDELSVLSGGLLKQAERIWR